MRTSVAGERIDKFLETEKENLESGRQEKAVSNFNDMINMFVYC